MSLESAKKFIERMKTDEDFRKKVNECKDAEGRMDLVKHDGFDFTAEELKGAGAELTERELDMVGGGVGGWICMLTGGFM